MLDALGHVLIVPAVILGLIAAVWVLSFVRNPLVALIGYVARFIVTALATAERALRAAGAHLRVAAERALDGLAYRGQHAGEEEEPSSYRGWHVIGPLVYFGAVILMALGDFYIMILRLQALLGLPARSSSVGLPIDQLMGILWLVMVAVYGSVVFDLHGLSPTARPFQGASSRLRTWLRIAAWAGVVLSLIAGGILWLWGDFAIHASTSGATNLLSTSFLVMFAALLFGALVLASWSVVPACIALWFLFLSALRIVCWCLGLICSLLVRLVEALAYVLVAMVDLPARLGLMLHNYLAEFEWAQRMHWLPRPAFAVLAPIAPDVRQNVLGDVDDGYTAATGSGSVFISPSSPVLLPAPQPLPHSDSRTTITVLSIGPLGAALMNSLWPALKAQLPMKALLVVGAFDDGAPQPREMYRASGALDIGPTPHEIAHARREAVSPADFRHRLLEGMLSRVRQACISADAMEGQIIVLASPEALDASAREQLTDLKRRRPEQEIIVVADNLWLDPDAPSITEAYGALAQLHAKDIVTAVLLLDTAHKSAAQRAGIAIASLIGARAYEVANPSLVGVAKRLSVFNPFIQLRTDCKDVDATLPVDGPIFARQKPVVSLQDAVIQARDVSKKLLQQGRTGVLVLTVPLNPRDRLWQQFCDVIRSWLEEQSRAAERTFAMPVFMPGRTFEIHAATLYPLAEVRTLAGDANTLAELAPYVPATEEEPIAATTRANGAHPSVEAQPPA